MKLFIRSQSGESLVEFNNIYLDSSRKNIHYLISQQFSTEGDFILGKFKKKENAIKVLNDIQKILVGYSPLLGKGEEFYKVYQVPKEEELDK